MQRVTPSRVCELKCDYSREQIYTTGSHPHGCVSWNIKENNLTVLTVAVTPSRVCELKSEWENTARSISQVTPSRVCELKLEINKSIKSPLSHTLTGVWVEIRTGTQIQGYKRSHTLTGVWVEISFWKSRKAPTSHTLTGMYWKLWQFPDSWFAPITPKIQS